MVPNTCQENPAIQLSTVQWQVSQYHQFRCVSFKTSCALYFVYQSTGQFLFILVCYQEKLEFVIHLILRCHRFTRLTMQNTLHNICLGTTGHRGSSVIPHRCRPQFLWSCSASSFVFTKKKTLKKVSNVTKMSKMVKLRRVTQGLHDHELATPIV